MSSRTVRKLLLGWAFLSVLWVVAVGLGTYEYLPTTTATDPRAYTTSEVIKIGAVFALGPPVLIFIGGVRLFRVFRGFR